MIRAISFTFGLMALLLTTSMLPAQTVKATADVTGQWHFVLDTPGGDRPSDADFKVADGKVTGKYGKADVAGMFADGKLDLAFPIDTEEAGSGTLKLTGTLDGDTITGNWSFTEYNGTFKATRMTGAAKGAGGI